MTIMKRRAIYVNRRIINPLDVIEQFTYLMFMKQLGESNLEKFL